MEWVEGGAKIAGLAAAILTTIYLLLKIYMTWEELNSDHDGRESRSSGRIIFYCAILLLLAVLIALAYEKIKLIMAYRESGMHAALMLHLASYAFAARFMQKV
jgi:hypothetical protein